MSRNYIEVPRSDSGAIHPFKVFFQDETGRNFFRVVDSSSAERAVFDAVLKEIAGGFNVTKIKFITAERKDKPLGGKVGAVLEPIGTHSVPFGDATDMSRGRKCENILRSRDEKPTKAYVDFMNNVAHWYAHLKLYRYSWEEASKILSKQQNGGVSRTFSGLRWDEDKHRLPAAFRRAFGWSHVETRAACYAYESRKAIAEGAASQAVMP